MLVAPDGQWVSPGSTEFCAALGEAKPDCDSITFAVKNLGFIKFQFHEQSLIEVELHPSAVKLPAMFAAQQQLVDTKSKLFRIKYFEDKWQSKIFASAEDTVAKLSQLCAP